MTRRRENDSFVLSEILNIRMSEHELEFLRSKASAEKISVGAYVRFLIRKDLHNA